MSDLSKDAHQHIANTILAQLGGNRFKAMTGAKDFLFLSSTAFGGLQFGLPARSAKDGISRVIIKVTPHDTYDVEFGKITGSMAKGNMAYSVVSRTEGIFGDRLADTFVAATGLDVSFGQSLAGSADSQPRAAEARMEMPPVTRVYDFPNGYRSEAENMFRWLNHHGLTPSWLDGDKDNKGYPGMAIGIPGEQLGMLRQLQIHNPARFGSSLTQPLADNNKSSEAEDRSHLLTIFVVLYREDEAPMMDPPLAFVCRAENADHAEEQAQNAYPSADIAWVYEGSDPALAREDYFTAGDPEAHSLYVVSVTYEVITEESAVDGDAAERGHEIEHEPHDFEGLQALVRQYGTTDPSASSPGPRVWFSSTSPVEDRAFFEDGESRFHSLHIHTINGRELEAEDFQRLANKLGITFSHPLTLDVARPALDL